MEMLHDRITLANTISTLEDDAQDGSYGATTMDDNVLPVGAEEMGAGVIIYLLSLNRVRAMLDMPLSLNFNLTIINCIKCGE